MSILITSSTASAPIGFGHQGHLFAIPDGPYAGRMIAIFARTPSTIAWSRADAPYTDWSDPADVITDAADEPAAAVMDVAGNIHIVYTASADGALRYQMLVHAGGAWVTGTSTTIYASATSSNRYPAVLRDTENRIRVVWTRIDSGVYSLRSKSSADGGVTFGGGASDPGLELDSGMSSIHAQLLQRSTFIHCFYTLDGAALKHRRIEINAGLWESAETLFTGTFPSPAFHAALSDDNVLGLVFSDDASVCLKEYDGAVWGALQIVADAPVTSPILTYVGATPFVHLPEPVGPGQLQIAVTQRVSGVFAQPVPVLRGTGPFDSVFCVDADAGTPLADCTAAAGDSTTADVVHPESGALVRDVGDILYLGMNVRFDHVHMTLATPGSGGNVAWEYWNGSAWVGFTPESGANALDMVTTSLRLFADSSTIPSDWIKTSVNDVYRYWIRAVVSAPYTVAPVGTQITAATNITRLSPVH
ncbi:MAG: hypothetical protein Kow0074_23660 [Candidatus Zixiibacteriota bacterium]